MEFDGGEEDEYNAINFVETFKIFATHGALFLGTGQIQSRYEHYALSPNSFKFQKTQDLLSITLKQIKSRPRTFTHCHANTNILKALEVNMGE